MNNDLNMSINDEYEKNIMMNKEKIDLIDFLISEMDELEPEYKHYEYYYKQLSKNNDFFDNYRKCFIKKVVTLPKETLVNFMITHYFYHI